jgi:hypothetical protein
MSKYYPGRPKNCENIPGDKACLKQQKNGKSLTCKNCRYSNYKKF